MVVERRDGDDTPSGRDNLTIVGARARVKDDDIRIGFSIVESADRGAARVGSWVSVRCHHDRYCTTNYMLLSTTSRKCIEPTLRGRVQKLTEVAIVEREHDLCFGIAKSTIEFNDAELIVIDHQSGEETTDEWTPKLSHPHQCRFDNVAA